MHSQLAIDHSHLVLAHLAGAARVEDGRAVVAAELEQRMHTLEGSTMVTWRSASHDLLAAGFSCELYSELIRLDSAHALDRLLRRYPCLQVGESSLPFLRKEHSPTTNR